MKLEFDSVEDLAYFLDWADKYRNAGALGMIGVAVDTAQCASAAVDGDPLPTIDASAGMPPVNGSFATSIASSPLSPTAGDTGGTTPEPARRKRRTKAEIEADEKAAADAAGADLKAASDAGAAEPAAGEAPPAGANPFEQVATAPAGESVAADTGGESDVVTPFQHITRAKAFIAKHGTLKYGESFAKAGLDANVMGYTAYQRGVHMAALDDLEKA